MDQPRDEHETKTRRTKAESVAPETLDDEKVFKVDRTSRVSPRPTVEMQRREVTRRVKISRITARKRHHNRTSRYSSYISFKACESQKNFIFNKIIHIRRQKYLFYNFHEKFRFSYFSYIFECNSKKIIENLRC